MFPGTFVRILLMTGCKSRNIAADTSRRVAHAYTPLRRSSNIAPRPCKVPHLQPRHVQHAFEPAFE